MNKTIRGILFDKDGTLLDYHSSWSEINEKAAAFAAAGQSKLQQKLLRVGGMNPVTKITQADSALAAGNTLDICKLWIKAGSPIQIDMLRIGLDRIFIEAARHCKPAPKLKKTIIQLVGQGYLLGVASSDSEAAIDLFLTSQGLTSKFDFIAGYDSGFGHKPNSGMLLGFCNAMNLLPEEVAVVGDNTHDLQMARTGGAGLGIGVLTGTGCKDTLRPLSDFICESIADVSALLHTINANDS